MAVSDCIRTCRQCGNEFKLVAGRPGRKPSKCEKCKIPVRACAGCGVSLPSGPGRPRLYCDQCKACRPNPQRKASAPKTQLESRPCCVCGAEFKSAQPRAIYCSKKCRGSAKGRRQPRRTRDAFCVVCGIEFKSYSSTGAPGGWTQCCSDACGRKSRSLRAMALRAEVEALARIAEAWRWKPSDLVQAEAAALRRIARYREREFRKPCECCGIDVLCLSDMRKKLCDECRVERKAESARRSRQTPKGRASRKRDKAVRRAKVSIASERIDPMAVFERDRWTCQLCGKRTPRRLRGQMVPDAPELDHIIPLALGGAHLWSNVQCACRACNGRKGARPLGQMGLPLAA